MLPAGLTLNSGPQTSKGARGPRCQVRALPASPRSLAEESTAPRAPPGTCSSPQPPGRRGLHALHSPGVPHPLPQQRRPVPQRPLRVRPETAWASLSHPLCQLQWAVCLLTALGTGEKGSQAMPTGRKRHAWEQRQGPRAAWTPAGGGGVRDRGGEACHPGDGIPSRARSPAGARVLSGAGRDRPRRRAEYTLTRASVRLRRTVTAWSPTKGGRLYPEGEKEPRRDLARCFSEDHSSLEKDGFGPSTEKGLGGTSSPQQPRAGELGNGAGKASERQDPSEKCEEP